MATQLVALGDSLSCGEGVGVRVPLEQTWPVRLGACLPDATVTSLARPGAKVRDVLVEQLPAALVEGPDVVTLLVGLNDVLRSASCEVFDDLLAVLQPLVDSGVLVLVARLHDPTLLLPLGPFADAVRRRVSAVNDSIDRAVAAAGGRVVVLDLAAVDRLQARDCWAVDRLHPSARGHAVMAAAAGESLVAAGLPANACAVTVPSVTIGPAAELAWIVRHGLPYAAWHGRRMVPGLLAMR